MTTWPLQKDCNKFYGDPRGTNGGPNAKWESANLVMVKCPWVLRYAGKPVKGLRVHKKCAESLEIVLEAIWIRLGKSQAEIDRTGMSVYGGGYNYRLMRGGNSLSMHSWGCALDFDPANNGLGDPTPKMDLRVVEEFEREGWEWGGHWSRKDGMHFQAARTQANPKKLKGGLPAPTPTDLNAIAMSGEPNTITRGLQADLNAMAYFCGEEDGRWGGKTKGAVSAFKLDRGLPGPALIEPLLIAEVAKATKEKFTRPISAARANATASELKHKLPEVKEATDAKWYSKVLAWFTGSSTVVYGASDYIGAAMDQVAPIRSFWPERPFWIALGGVAVFVLAIILYKKSQGAAQASTDAYNVGARS